MRNPSNRPVRRWRRAIAVTAILAASPALPAFAEMLEAPKPIHRENPAYPYSALARGVEGSVLVEYTVDGNGQVVAPRVIEATPPGVFDRAALRALSRWRYEALGAEPTTMKVKLTFKK
ncbi:MAG TPA: energy transducer TonB [Myxococcota bacterium]|nr:energy transducer TonB [Myxococcota bacterium]